MSFMNRFLLFTNLLFVKGGENTMVELYVILIINGRRTLERVPAKLREDVRKMLTDMGLDETGKPVAE